MLYYRRAPDRSAKPSFSAVFASSAVFSYFAVAGTPTVTALGALDARRLKAITDATSASAALP
jgi:hypothetical protein